MNLTCLFKVTYGILCFLVLPVLEVDRIAGKPIAARSEIISSSGISATNKPTPQTALDILKAGGNAADAPIAAKAAFDLMEPTGNGIGGDLFAIVQDARTQRPYGLNASGRDEVTEAGGLSQARTGKKSVSWALARDSTRLRGGLVTWHERFGAPSMADVLAPAIRYASAGFPVSELISHNWELKVPILQGWPGFVESGHHLAWDVGSFEAY